MTGTAGQTPQRPAGRGAVRQSAARLAAVQALYQIDQSEAPPDEVLEEFLRFRLGESFDTEDDVAPDKGLFTELVRGTSTRLSELDDIVRATLSNQWTLERLASILRSILRVGVYELEARRKTPARVVITEYVDVAHAFFDGQEPGMVNGVLDRVAQTLRPEEFGPAAAGDADGEC